MVNRWLRELPASGAPAPSSWENYARAVKEWAEFLAGHGVGLFDSRERLKSGLSRYAEHRAAGPVTARFAATTWGQHMSILSLFYRWAIAEGYAAAEPFTYRSARALFAGTGREIRVNLAVRRTPKPHVTIKYLEPDFTELFRKGLRGLAPDGSRDSGFAGRHRAPVKARFHFASAHPAAFGRRRQAAIGGDHHRSKAATGRPADGSCAAWACAACCDTVTATATTGKRASATAAGVRTTSAAEDGRAVAATTATAGKRTTATPAEDGCAPAAAATADGCTGATTPGRTTSCGGQALPAERAEVLTWRIRRSTSVPLR